MYNKRIMALFANPKNVGIIQGASAIGHYTNESTNDVYKLYLKVEDEIIVDASFKAFCGADGIAIFSVLTELLFDKNINEVNEITEDDILEEIGEFSEDNLSVKDALETLKLTVIDYNKKQQKLLKLLEKNNK